MYTWKKKQTCLLFYTMQYYVVTGSKIPQGIFPLTTNKFIWVLFGIMQKQAMLLLIFLYIFSGAYMCMLLLDLHTCKRKGQVKSTDLQLQW